MNPASPRFGDIGNKHEKLVEVLHTARAIADQKLYKLQPRISKGLKLAKSKTKRQSSINTRPEIKQIKEESKQEKKQSQFKPIKKTSSLTNMMAVEAPVRDSNSVENNQSISDDEEIKDRAAPEDYAKGGQIVVQLGHSGGEDESSSEVSQS